MVGSPGIEPSSTDFQSVAEMTTLAHFPFDTYTNIVTQSCKGGAFYFSIQKTVHDSQYIVSHLFKRCSRLRYSKLYVYHTSHLESVGKRVQFLFILLSAFHITFLIKLVRTVGFEPTTPDSQRRCASQTALSADIKLVGVAGFEPATTWLRTKDSTRLSYTPFILVRTVGFEPTTTRLLTENSTRLS